MADIWFYHLDRSSLMEALPALLARSLDRGWRAVIQATSTERLEALDAALWAFDDASFLPHGTARDGDEDMQPVFLTLGTENPNRARIRFMVDGARVEDALVQPESVYDRIILLFDGKDEHQRADARAQWKALRANAHDVTYYQQDEDGRWVKRG